MAVAYGTLPGGLPHAELCGLYELRHEVEALRVKQMSRAFRLAGMAGGE